MTCRAARAEAFATLQLYVHPSQPLASTRVLQHGAASWFAASQLTLTATLLSCMNQHAEQARDIHRGVCWSYAGSTVKLKLLYHKVLQD